jgi:DNA-directed RNA polymerase specialized sigma24 family protein
MQTTTFGGSSSNFNRLIGQYQDQAFTLASHFLGDERLAEDLLQATVLDLYRRARDLPSGAFRPALFQALAHRLLAAPERPARSRVAARDPLACLRSLPPLCRLVVLLVDCLQMTYAEASLASGISLSEVRTCLTRARLGLGKFY